LDPTDVVQESYFEIARRISEFVQSSPVPLFVWIRQRVLQTLIDMQRSHSREKRNVHRESRLPESPFGQTTSLSIARILMDDLPSPSQAAMLGEEQEQLREALEAMNETDREVLAMRHFEYLSNAEVAEVLGISPTAASNRYVRAAAKLSEILKMIPSRRGPHDR
jgi:RNA polymerase sigma-70 factor (ECF subfamily)